MSNLKEIFNSIASKAMKEEVAYYQDFKDATFHTALIDAEDRFEYLDSAYNINKFSEFWIAIGRYTEASKEQIETTTCTGRGSPFISYKGKKYNFSTTNEEFINSGGS